MGRSKSEFPSSPGGAHPGEVTPIRSWIPVCCSLATHSIPLDLPSEQTTSATPQSLKVICFHVHLSPLRVGGHLLRISSLESSKRSVSQLALSNSSWHEMKGHYSCREQMTRDSTLGGLLDRCQSGETH
ncbi:hypothetical protein CapIbe_001771 [Capra ibex]